MKCGKVKLKIMDYIGGILSGAENKLISEHVENCEACRRETEAARLLLTDLKEEEAWSPPSAYWPLLVPEIHGRIEVKSARKLSGAVIRFIAPVAGALVLTLLIVQFASVRSDATSGNIKMELEQLTEEELDEYLNRQSIFGFIESAGASGDLLSTSDDKAIIRDMIGQNGELSAYIELDDLLMWEKISDDAAEKLISIMAKYYAPS